MYVCWSAFCIYNYILIISGYLCFTTSTCRSVCVLICIHAHCSVFHVVRLLDRHFLCSQVSAQFSLPGCFSHFAVFLFTHFLSFPLSAAQPKLKIGESEALSRISVRSLCLCAGDNSSAVLPLKLFPLKLPLCSGC